MRSNRVSIRSRRSSSAESPGDAGTGSPPRSFATKKSFFQRVRALQPRRLPRARSFFSPKGASEALRVFRNGCGDGALRTFEAPLDHERRIAFEFVHQLVNDLINRELDIPLPKGLALLAGSDPDNWVVRMLTPLGA